MKETIENYIKGSSSFNIPLSKKFNKFVKFSGVPSTESSSFIDLKLGDDSMSITVTPKVSLGNSSYRMYINCTLTDIIQTDETYRGSYELILTTTQNTENQVAATGSISYEYSELKLNPEDYKKLKSVNQDENNLDALVTKKGLITNLSEFARQLKESQQTHTIQYDLNGGEWTEGKRGATHYNSNFSYDCDSIHKVGYTFKGWKTTKVTDKGDIFDGSESFPNTVHTVVPANTQDDVLAVAQWDPVRYTIIVTPQDVSQNITYGSNTPLKLSITDSFCNTDLFRYTDPQGNEYFIHNGESADSLYDIVQTGNISVDLIRESKDITINYDVAAGGTLSSAPSQKYDCTTDITLPTPTRVGYKFLGWDMAGVGGVNPITILTRNDLGDSYQDTYTLNAQWEAIKYRVFFELEDGSFSKEPNYTISNGSTITITPPTRNGYTFTGWKADHEMVTCRDNDITVADGAGLSSDVMLTAIWKESFFNVTLHINKETLVSGEYMLDTVDSIKVKSNTSISIQGQQLSYKNESGVGALKNLAQDNFTLATSLSSQLVDKDTVLELNYDRSLMYYKINDFYDDEYASQDRDNATEHLRASSLENNLYSIKYGKVVTIDALVKDGYSVDHPSISFVATTGTKEKPYEAKFTYSRDIHTVVFNTNNCSSFRDKPTLPIISEKVKYGYSYQLKEVDNNPGVKSSSWQASYGTTIEEGGKSTIVRDEVFNRIPIYETLSVTITNSPAEAGNAPSIPTLTIQELPYVLQPHEVEGYEFKNYTLNGKVVTSLIYSDFSDNSASVSQNFTKVENIIEEKRVALDTSSFSMSRDNLEYKSNKNPSLDDDGVTLQYWYDYNPTSSNQVEASGNIFSIPTNGHTNIHIRPFKLVGKSNIFGKTYNVSISANQIGKVDVYSSLEDALYCKDHEITTTIKHCSGEDIFQTDTINEVYGTLISPTPINSLVPVGETKPFITLYDRDVTIAYEPESVKRSFTIKDSKGYFKEVPSSVNGLLYNNQVYTTSGPNYVSLLKKDQSGVMGTYTLKGVYENPTATINGSHHPAGNPLTLTEKGYTLTLDATPKRYNLDNGQHASKEASFDSNKLTIDANTFGSGETKSVDSCQVPFKGIYHTENYTAESINEESLSTVIQNTINHSVTIKDTVENLGNIIYAYDVYRGQDEIDTMGPSNWAQYITGPSSLEPQENSIISYKNKSFALLNEGGDNEDYGIRDDFTYQGISSLESLVGAYYYATVTPTLVPTPETPVNGDTTSHETGPVDSTSEENSEAQTMTALSMEDATQSSVTEPSSSEAVPTPINVVYKITGFHDNQLTVQKEVLSESSSSSNTLAIDFTSIPTIGDQGIIIGQGTLKEEDISINGHIGSVVTISGISEFSEPITLIRMVEIVNISLTREKNGLMNIKVGNSASNLKMSNILCGETFKVQVPIYVGATKCMVSREISINTTDNGYSYTINDAKYSIP